MWQGSCISESPSHEPLGDSCTFLVRMFILVPSPHVWEHSPIRHSFHSQLVTEPNTFLNGISTWNVTKNVNFLSRTHTQKQYIPLVVVKVAVVLIVVVDTVVEVEVVSFAVEMRKVNLISELNVISYILHSARYNLKGKCRLENFLTNNIFLIKAGWLNSVGDKIGGCVT